MGFTSFLQQAISTLRERLLPLRGPFPIDQSPARDRVSPITNVSTPNSGGQKKTLSNGQPVVCVQQIESNIVPDASSLEELSGREVDEANSQLLKILRDFHPHLMTDRSSSARLSSISTRKAVAHETHSSI